MEGIQGLAVQVHRAHRQRHLRHARQALVERGREAAADLAVHQHQQLALAVEAAVVVVADDVFAPTGPVIVAEQLPATHPSKKPAQEYRAAYQAVQALRPLQPAILTVHAAGGLAMMEDAKAAAGEHTKVVAVTVLTSLDNGDLASTGVNCESHEQVLRLADLAQEAGLDGIVCSGHEVGDVHRRWKDGFLVVPGLRPADGSGNGSHADQKRIVTPRQARDNGASVLVIGRPISRAEDPVAAARAIEATL